jgi:hypothetical protein
VDTLPLATPETFTNLLLKVLKYSVIFLLLGIPVVHTDRPVLLKYLTTSYSNFTDK